MDKVYQSLFLGVVFGVLLISVDIITNLNQWGEYESKCWTQGYVFANSKCYIPHTVPYIPEEAL